uniref:Uncharacterized protein n=2 Tax=Ixodes scapularis TaxID=6945 RepID=A0A1S4KVP5_IXOSC
GTKIIYVCKQHALYDLQILVCKALYGTVVCFQSVFIVTYLEQMERVSNIVGNENPVYCSCVSSKFSYLVSSNKRQKKMVDIERPAIPLKNKYLTPLHKPIHRRGCPS